jgi:diacylglycerol kinase family enzyme
MASVGIDGTAIRRYETYRSRGYRGLNAHVRAALSACFRHYRPTDGRLITDGVHRRIRHLTSLMVVKQPFFGMGLKAVPHARWNDGYLHTLTIASGLPGVAAALISGFTVGNQVGDYRRATSATIGLDAPLSLQIDGEAGWTADRFAFRVIPGALRLKH